MPVNTYYGAAFPPPVLLPRWADQGIEALPCQHLKRGAGFGQKELQAVTGQGALKLKMREGRKD